MYRIKTRQRYNFDRFLYKSLSEDYGKSYYYVQYKYKLIPFWITITTAFDSVKQAQEHIDLKTNILEKA